MALRTIGLALLMMAATAQAQGPGNGWQDAPAARVSEKPESAPKRLTLFRGAVLIDGNGGVARPNMSILVEGDRIKAVMPDAEVARYTGDIVDASRLYVLPGLIDTHEHLATSPDRNWAEAQMKRDLYGGITAVRDMAGDVRALGELSRASLLGEIAGPDIYYAALMAGPSFFDDPRTIAAAQGAKPGATAWMQAVDDRTDMALAVARARGTGATGLKIYANLSGDMVRKITEEAHRQGFPVWAHSQVSPAIPADVVAARPDVISHICAFGWQASARRPQSYRDRVPVDPAPFAKGDNAGMAALFREMKRKGIVMDATLRVYVEGDKRAAETGKPSYCPADIAYRLTNQAWREGVMISAGTDGMTDAKDAYSALHEELELLSDKAGLPPMDVIRAATSIAARTIAQEKEMGSVEPGKLANLVFVAKDPLLDVSNLRSVVFTVKRGTVYRREDYKSGMGQ
jgi:imidazolonepropionase-like amidohydrolase